MVSILILSSQGDLKVWEAWMCHLCRLLSFPDIQFPSRQGPWGGGRSLEFPWGNEKIHTGVFLWNSLSIGKQDWIIGNIWHIFSQIWLIFIIHLSIYLPTCLPTYLIFSIGDDFCQFFRRVRFNYLMSGRGFIWDTLWVIHSPKEYYLMYNPWINPLT